MKVSQDLAVFPQDFQDFIFVKTLEALISNRASNCLESLESLEGFESRKISRLFGQDIQDFQDLDFTDFFINKAH